MARQAHRIVERPRVGITGTHKPFSPSWTFLSLAVWLAGGMPRRIHLQQRVKLKDLQAVIVSGGDDIHPTLYESEPARQTAYDRQRDELELEHIHYARAHGLPLLGICRGHQLINVAWGGNLYQDINPLRRHTSTGRSLLPRKRVRISSSTKILQLLRKSEIMVNSLHNQAIDRVGVGLYGVAFDRDNFIQAIESSSAQPLLGVQWHPEYLFFMPTQFRIFRWLTEEAQIHAERQRG
jgi:putative glutamine amidotransferase